MKAVLLKRSSAGLKAEATEVAVPRIGQGELLVEMKACGLCGTDLEKLKGEYTASAPVLGHEAVGVVSAVGSGDTGLRVGDRVFPHHHVACGGCYYCEHGDQPMCTDYRGSNLDPCGFSEFFRVPRWNVVRGGVLRLPGEMTFELGALIEPLACCIRALGRCEVKPGDSVLVAGAGPVGMSLSILLDLLGAEVMVSDVAGARLEFIRTAGAGTPMDAKSPGYPEEVRRRTGGRGVDVGIVASGSAKAVSQTLKAVRKGGRLCLFGVPTKGSMLDYDLSDIYNSDVSIRPSYGATEVETAKAVAALTKDRERFMGLITHKFPIEDFEAAVRAASDGTAMKVLVTP